MGNGGRTLRVAGDGANTIGAGREAMAATGATAGPMRRGAMAATGGAPSMALPATAATGATGGRGPCLATWARPAGMVGTGATERAPRAATERVGRAATEGWAETATRACRRRMGVREGREGRAAPAKRRRSQSRGEPRREQGARRHQLRQSFGAACQGGGGRAGMAATPVPAGQEAWGNRRDGREGRGSSDRAGAGYGRAGRRRRQLPPGSNPVVRDRGTGRGNHPAPKGTGSQGSPTVIPTVAGGPARPGAAPALAAAAAWTAPHRLREALLPFPAPRSKGDRGMEIGSCHGREALQPLCSLAWAWAVAACVLSATLEGALSGTRSSAGSPSFACHASTLPLWAWSFVGLAYYILFLLILHSLFAGPRSLGCRSRLPAAFSGGQRRLELAVLSAPRPAAELPLLFPLPRAGPLPRRSCSGLRRPHAPGTSSISVTCLATWWGYSVWRLNRGQPLRLEEGTQRRKFRAALAGQPAKPETTRRSGAGDVAAAGRSGEDNAGHPGDDLYAPRRFSAAVDSTLRAFARTLPTDASTLRRTSLLCSRSPRLCGHFPGLYGRPPGLYDRPPVLCGRSLNSAAVRLGSTTKRLGSAAIRPGSRPAAFPVRDVANKRSQPRWNLAENRRAAPRTANSWRLLSGPRKFFSGFFCDFDGRAGWRQHRSPPPFRLPGRRRRSPLRPPRTLLAQLLEHPRRPPAEAARPACAFMRQLAGRLHYRTSVGYGCPSSCRPGSSPRPLPDLRRGPSKQRSCAPRGSDLALAGWPPAVGPCLAALRSRGRGGLARASPRPGCVLDLPEGASAPSGWRCCGLSLWRECATGSSSCSVATLAWRSPSSLKLRTGCRACRDWVPPGATSLYQP